MSSIIWQAMEQLIKASDAYISKDASKIISDLLARLIRSQDKLSSGNAKIIWYLKPLFQFMYYNYFRVGLVGLKNIPSYGPAIIVANHAGCLPYDGMMVSLAVTNEHRRPRTVRFLVHNFAFRLPFISHIVRQAGGIEASFENALSLIRKKELILAFPEGISGIGKEFDERYKLRPFGRGGFVKLAIRTKTPVIPAAIIGSEEIHPIIWASERFAKPLGVPFFPFTPTFPWLGPLGLIPLPSKWKIIFGKPVNFKRFKIRDAENDTLMRKMADDVRQRIQKMINTSLARRKSIWF